MDKKFFLTIAGSDSIAGAGLQADLKTAMLFDYYGCCVATAITAQNSCGVHAVMPVDTQMVECQLLSILEDLRPNAVKIGLLPSIETIKTVSKILKAFELKNVVCDPVIAPTFGNSFLSESLIKAMVKYIFPISDFITPNLPEKNKIEEITGIDITKAADAVLVKGGHGKGNVISDTLIINDKEKSEQTRFEYSNPRIETKNSHGTGCVLSSAIAMLLGLGMPYTEATEKAINFVNKQLANNKNKTFGKCGYGPTLF